METECHLYEAVVVDEDLPMDRYHEDEEVYEILARNEPHAKLAVSMVLGSRYGVIEFTADRVREFENPMAQMETDPFGVHPAINAFEVFREGRFTVRFNGESGARHETSFDSLITACQWYLTSDDSAHFADHPKRTQPRYSAVTDVTHGDMLESLSSRTVHQYIEEETGMTPVR